MPDPTKPFSTHGYREGGNPVWNWIKESTKPEPPEPTGEGTVGAYGAPAPQPTEPEPPAIDEETEFDIQQAVKDLVGPSQGMSVPGGLAPVPQGVQRAGAAYRAMGTAPLQRAPQAAPVPQQRGPRRPPPLPPGMAGQAGGMYYPPDYIQNLDLEHPQAGQALDQFTRYAASPMGRMHDLERTKQASAEKHGRGMAGAAVLQSMGDADMSGAYQQLQAQEAERFKRAQARRERMQKDYQAEVERYARAVDSVSSMKVDPERFWESKSTGSKIASAIFLALGAAGAGATGGPNYALGILNSQIDRDIDAQKANIGNKRAGLAGQQNLLSMMLQQYDTSEQAEAAAKMFAYEQVASKVKQIGATTSSLVTRQKTAAFLGQLADQKAILEKDLHLKGVLRAAEIERARMIANADAARRQDEQRRKMEQLQGWRPLDEKEARYIIPGWGIAAPTTGESSIPKLRDEAARMATHNQNLDRAIQIAEKGGTWSTLSPQERDEVQQLYYFVFNPEVKELSGAAVTDSEMGRYQKQFGRDPSSTWDSLASDVPKSLRRLKDQFNRGFGNKLKAYGVSGQAELLPNTDSGKWEWHVKNAPNSPQSSGAATLYDSQE